MTLRHSRPSRPRPWTLDRHGHRHAFFPPKDMIGDNLPGTAQALVHLKNQPARRMSGRIRIFKAESFDRFFPTPRSVVNCTRRVRNWARLSSETSADSVTWRAMRRQVVKRFEGSGLQPELSGERGSRRGGLEGRVPDSRGGERESRSRMGWKRVARTK